MQFGHLIRNFQLFSINHAHILLSSLQLNTDNWVTATLDETRDYDDFFPGDKKSNAMSDECRDLLEKEIMLDEIKSTIKSMKNNKTPGVDGLPVEFYKIFWNDIHDILLDSYNHSISLGYLSISQRRGVISLIPKTDKDPHFLKNWRPITLLSTDYKILSSLIATRIKKTIIKSYSSRSNRVFKRQVHRRKYKKST